MGGAERVAAAMHDSFPSAPMYTTVALPKGLPVSLRAANALVGNPAGAPLVCASAEPNAMARTQESRQRPRIRLVDGMVLGSPN